MREGDTKLVSWRETIGLIQAVLESQTHYTPTTVVNRYGKTMLGEQYVLDTTRSLEAEYDSIVIATSHIAVQSMGYDAATDRWNRIDYRPAYSYTQCAGGIALLKSVISAEGDMVIPVVRRGQKMLRPESVIADMHWVMSKD